MFGGSPGYYEVTCDVYKGKDFRRLSFPVSFILGEPCMQLSLDKVCWHIKFLL